MYLDRRTFRPRRKSEKLRWGIDEEASIKSPGSTGETNPPPAGDKMDWSWKGEADLPVFARFKGGLGGDPKPLILGELLFLRMQGRTFVSIEGTRFPNRPDPKCQEGVSGWEIRMRDPNAKEIIKSFKIPASTIGRKIIMSPGIKSPKVAINNRLPVLSLIYDMGIARRIAMK